MVALYNQSSEARIVSEGDRIAQIIIQPVEQFGFNVKENLSDTKKRVKVDLEAQERDKKLLSVKETCDYLGIGQTKCRELLREEMDLEVQIGNRWYANKEKLNKWIDNKTK